MTNYPEFWNVSYKRRTTLRYRLDWLNDHYYKQFWLFLVIMTIYHIAVILYSTFGIEIHSVKVLAMFSLDTEAMIMDESKEVLLQKIVFGLVTALLDSAFFILFYLSFAKTFIEKYNMDFGRYIKYLAGLELIVWIVSGYSLYMRIVLWFLSVNSMTILVPYIIMKRYEETHILSPFLSLLKYVFMTGSMINLIYFLLYPLHIGTLLTNLFYMKT